MAALEHGSHEMRHRGRRHADTSGEIRWGVRPFVEENAVDRVVIGPQAAIGHGADEEGSDALLGREELEEK